MMWPFNSKWHFARGKVEVAEITPDTATLVTPERIEDLINQAGRDAVFDKMRANGWTANDVPPLWVWNVACQEVLAERLGRA